MTKKIGGQKKVIKKKSSITEKKYVSIKELDPQISTKKTILWTSVIILSLAVISIWFILLKAQIEKKGKNLEFLSLINEVSESIKTFDKKLKNESLATIPKNINELKNEVLEELKQSVDSSLWPTKQLDQLELSLQLPIEWTIDLKNNEAVLMASSSSSTIKISLIKNLKLLSLPSWIEKNKPTILDGYSLKEPIFKFTESNQESLYYTNNQSTTTIDFIYLINSTSTKTIYTIMANSENSTEKNRKIIEEIIKTIKILK